MNKYETLFKTSYSKNIQLKQTETVTNKKIKYPKKENDLRFCYCEVENNEKHSSSLQSHNTVNYNRGKMILHEKYGFKLPENYQIKEIIGKGSYGIVAAAIEVTCEAPVAIKKVSNIFSKEVLLKRAIRELKFMRYFKGHKNVVNLLDLEIICTKGYDGLYCFQEMVDYDLSRVLHSSVQLSDFHIQSFFYQIICGLKYIHSADVIHRDLKPGNILCTIQGTLKICDFGLARGMNEDCFVRIKKKTGKHSHITSYVATRWYRAPELMLCRKKYKKSIDLWACGCILAEFYGRRPIFIGNDQMNQVVEILKVLGTPSKETIINYGSSVANEIFFPPKPQYSKVKWTNIYPFATDLGLNLIDQLLKWDPEKRLTCDQVLAHSFFKNVRNINEEPICPYGSFNFFYEYEMTSLTDLTKTLFKEVEDFKKGRITNSLLLPVL